MYPELKRLHSPDVYDLENYKPEDPEKFSFLLQAIVGPEDKDGEESFDIEVCTPKWLEDTYGIDDVVLGYCHLIVREYNYLKITHFIKEFLRNCSGENWNEVAIKVSRLGKWEFDNYNP
jgi:Immunity protein 8